ncbi:hypothetical protein CfE428DRAFT_0318 [Chthoniobacter flavus Ellin428]|uniref:Uncharacterized protein n=1 Tax=Chthoniobacter flavus Ellin428 TaxID=497964 RepID=B4CUF5_9BACT|nr:hypothetical protein CfE428DRAFT_0318 [Chthoniobacter flavus Ellin428]TCO94778.1 hypothetical protein EV701_102247 [Chthoniobacter flavus]
MNANSADAISSPVPVNKPIQPQRGSGWLEVVRDCVARVVIVALGMFLGWIGALIIAFVVGWRRLINC